MWSPDGQKIAFASWASNFVAGDTNQATDVFVKYLATGVVERVSTGTRGEQANRNSYAPRWAPDSTRLAFTSDANDLVPSDTNGASDVFVKSLASGEIQRVSTDVDGQQGNGDSSGASWSPDGKQVAFSSEAPNLVAEDTNYSEDVFVKNLTTGKVIVASADAEGQLAQGGPSFDPAWSPDGTRLAFSSFAWNLVHGDNNENFDIFVKTLISGDLVRVSVDAEDRQVYGRSTNPVWSPDGTRIAFDSDASKLVPEDVEGYRDVFVKVLQSGEVTWVSTDQDGVGGMNWSGDPVWSPDGSRIAFASGAWNWLGVFGNHIYVKTLNTGELELVSTDANGEIPIQSNSFSQEWSPDGSQIAFASDAANLVPDDENGSDDVFVKTLP